MDHKRHHSRLRSTRKKTGLTQKEVSFLAGLGDKSQLSRFERMKRLPSVETMIAIMIIFRKGPEELVPALYDRLLRLIRLRASELHEELQGDAHHLTKQKLDTLEAVLTNDDASDAAGDAPNTTTNDNQTTL